MTFRLQKTFVQLFRFRKKTICKFNRFKFANCYVKYSSMATRARRAVAVKRKVIDSESEEDEFDRIVNAKGKKRTVDSESDFEPSPKKAR